MGGEGRGGIEVVIEVEGVVGEDERGGCCGVGEGGSDGLYCVRGMWW